MRQWSKTFGAWSVLPSLSDLFLVGVVIDAVLSNSAAACETLGTRISTSKSEAVVQN